MICRKCAWNRSHHNPFTKCPCQGEIRTNGRDSAKGGYCIISDEYNKKKDKEEK